MLLAGPGKLPAIINFCISAVPSVTGQGYSVERIYYFSMYRTDTSLEKTNMSEYDYIVLGGGIAGASIAYYLADEGRLLILEQETQPGYHTTGRSVAVHTDSYGPEPVRKLARASIDFLLDPPDGFSDVPLQHPLGLVFVATEEQKDDLLGFLKSVQEISPDITEISVDRVIEMVPVMKADQLAAAFYDQRTIGLDVNAIHQGYLRYTRAGGGDLVCLAEVGSLKYQSGIWQVETANGNYSAPVIINAAGAWADVVADMAGVRRINIVPKRRTCIVFPAPEGLDVNRWPAIIDAHENYYFKSDAGALIGSLGDETPDVPCDVQPDEMDVAMTVDRIENATTMTIDRLVRKWAGLRSFVEDRCPVIGYAPDAEGFFWCAGQGGYGIATSPALGKCAAELVLGRDFPGEVLELGVRQEDLAPQRLWHE